MDASEPASTQQMSNLSFDPNWQYDQEAAKTSIKLLTNLDSSFRWIESSTPQAIVFSAVRSLLDTLISFGMSLISKKKLFDVKYKIDNQLPQYYQNILNQLDHTYNDIQASYLELSLHLFSAPKFPKSIEECMDELNLNCKTVTNLSTSICHQPKQLFEFYDIEQVVKCKNLLLEIQELDIVLLQKLPALTTKYSVTIDDIKLHAILLSTYKIPLPKLPLLLAYSHKNYHSFKEEKNAGMYSNYLVAADKLEKSLLTSISKIQEVLQELNMFVYEEDSEYVI